MLYKVSVGILLETDDIGLSDETVSKFRSALMSTVLFGDARIQEEWLKAATAETEFFGKTDRLRERCQANLRAFINFMERALVIAKEDLKLVEKPKAQ